MATALGRPTATGVHAITAVVARAEDRSLPLRVVSLTHRRAVVIVEMHWEVPDEGAAPYDGRVRIVFRSSEQAARLVWAELESMVGIVDPLLEVDVAAALDRA